MQIPVSEYREWIEKRNDPEDRKQVARAVLDAYEELTDRTTIEEHELEPIVAAATSPYLVAWDIGTTFLVRLAKKNSTAQEAIRNIAFHARKVNARFQIVATLRPGLPEKLCVEIVKRALHDKGNRVREKAVFAADRLHLKQLLPDLEARLGCEEHPNVRWHLKYHIAMLRDGYLLERDEKGNPMLTVRTKNGWASPPITQQDLDDGRLQDIVKQVQSNPLY